MTEPNCPKQETCEDFSNGSKRKVHHIRLTECCIYWQFKKCIRQGDCCEIKKIKRIKGELR